MLLREQNYNIYQNTVGGIDKVKVLEDIAQRSFLGGN
jgi:hypothetical protein